jgi:hypothetical protein
VNDVVVFLVLILVAAVVLFAVVSGAKPRGRRGSGRTGQNRAAVSHLSRSELATRWATIQAMAGPAGGGNGLRQAVLEADKLLDQALRQAGVPGDSMGDRLKAARNRFPDRDVYDGIWRAHKLRNALAHEIAFDLVPSQAREALAGFERGLKALGAL